MAADRSIPPVCAVEDDSEAAGIRRKLTASVRFTLSMERRVSSAA
jgi:hypothetical protein